MRLIDADALMQAMYNRAFETDGDTMWQSGCWVRYRAIEQVVKEQPTIEERKTGKWRAFKIGECDLIECTACKVARPREEMPARNGGKIAWKYCPDCGARMEE